jgi:hypothetical protein
VKSLTLVQLRSVWRGILANPEAENALAKLEQDGFPSNRPKLHDLKHPSWANYVAAIPFLPNRSSRRRTHQGKTLRKHLSLVNVLREFAADASDPFCEIQVRTKNEILFEGSREFSQELGQAANLIEKLISSNWSVRDRNPRYTVIAQLRRTVRYLTGTPHDSALATLIDAALSTAGKKCIFLDPHRLDRIEKRETEGRMKSARHLDYLRGLSPTPTLSLSTRFPQKRKKQV